ncbi:ANKL1 protein, partial [Penelope pileata]|nr:ANKL1 protein [Penelope pileata]
SAEGLTPLHVAASLGCYGCLELLLQEGGDAELQDQDGKRAMELALEQGHGLCVQLLQDWARTEALRGARRSLSFLTEDCSDVGPLSSTRLSQLEEPGLGSSCGSGEPPAWLGCAPARSIPSLTLWPPRGSALPPQPLASSTLLWAAGDPGEGPLRGTGMCSPPKHSTGARSPPQPLRCSGDQGVLQAGAGDDTQILPRTPDQAGSPVGTSSSSPTVLLGPGDGGVLQDSPSDAQGSPRATDLRVLERGNPPVPRSPTARSPHCPVEPNGEVPSGWHSPGTEATSACDTAVPKERARSPWVLSDDALLRRLRALGYDPGPITELTRRVYLRRLEELSRSPTGHSPELVAALRTGHIPDCTEDEVALARQFDRPDRSRHWREGLLKASFNYLLLDPRTTQDLPQRCHRLSPTECFRTFIDAIFYVGKGTRARPCCHLAEALTQYHLGTKKGCPKVRRILEIWASGMGVISLQCFQGRIPAEAYTRESCLVEALGLRAITNQRKGNCYGVAASWPPARRRRLGVHMLHRALHIFLAEGEQQLRPDDISTGR